MKAVSVQKEDLRKVIIQKRALLPVNVWQQKSELIIKNLRSYKPFRDAKRVHTFVSMNDRKEVDTHSLIKELLNTGVKIIIPATDFTNNRLIHTHLTNFDELTANKWGVYELPNPAETGLKPDVILVPLLAADKQFNRLGYGKGFYDRFLSQTGALKIGFVFEEFIFDRIPAEESDVRLDVLITENSVLERQL